jgi:hypothetical protein
VVALAPYFKDHVAIHVRRQRPAGALMRRLLCSRRQVALDTVDEYLISWLVVRNAVLATGARAWIFRGALHEDQFLEFIEWDDADMEPLEDERVREALARLTPFGATASSDEWEEAT